MLRTIRKLKEMGDYETTFVLGHDVEPIRKAVPDEYPRYEEDKNIHSTLLGLEDSDESTIVIEGDVAFANAAMADIAAMNNAKRSLWTAC